MSANKRIFWDEIAPTYDQLYQSKWSRREDIEVSGWLREILQYKADLRVLDIGCGTGLGYTLIREIAPTCEYVGVDFSEKMIDEFHRKLGLNNQADERVSLHVIAADDVVRLFPRPIFDLIILLNAAGSYVGGPTKVFRNCKRLLNPKGALFASFLNRTSLRRCLRRLDGPIEEYKTRGASGDGGLEVIPASRSEIEVRCIRQGLDAKWIRYQSVLGGVAEKRWLIPLERISKRIVPELGHTANLYAVNVS